MFSMKKTLSLVLALALCLTLMMPGAMAASKPSISISTTSLQLHPGETGSITIKAKNMDSYAVKGMSVTVSDQSKNFDDDIEVSYDWAVTTVDLHFTAKSAGPVKHTYKVKVTLAYSKPTESTPPIDDGDDDVGVNSVAPAEMTITRTFKITFTIADNFAPKLKWSEIRLNEESGYPELWVRMTDDFGLMTVCFLRDWTDANGVAQHEIYDIYSLFDETDLVRFRTLNLPGDYSLQINDNGEKTLRNNTKRLVTLLDTDGNGVVDAYYTDDATKVTNLNVPGGITPVEEPTETTEATQTPNP